MQKIRKQSEGFTIIEVLIVLVIAAVIMLIVFLAVPALQRNSRNNGRRNDAGRLASAVTEYTTNNNGAMPPDAASVTNISGTLSQYGAADVSRASGAQSAITSENSIRVVVDARCGTAGAAVADTRNAAIQFAVETSSSPSPACIDV